MEMSGNVQAFDSMLRAMNHGGRIASLGIFPGSVAIDWDLVIFKGLVIKGVYGREMFETWYKMVSMLQSGLDISSVITHRLGVDEFEDGIRALREAQAGKVVLDW
jgi:threonine 3-dehydrogenase